MYADVLISQAPNFVDYAEGLKQYWNASKHPENVRDIAAAAQESFRDLRFPLVATIGTATLLGLEALELSPLNETILTEIATSNFEASGGEDVAGSAVRVGLATAALEGTIGLGFAYIMHKAKPVVDIVTRRYIPKAQANEEAIEFQETAAAHEKAKGNRFTRAAKTVGRGALFTTKAYGLGLSTGAGGATVLYGTSKGPEQPRAATYAFAATTAGMLALHDTAIAAGILYGTKSNNETIKNVCETVVDVVSNPAVVFGFLGSLYGIGLLRERRANKKKLKAEGRW